MNLGTLQLLDITEEDGEESAHPTARNDTHDRLKIEIPEVSDATASEFGKDSEVQSTTNIEKHSGVLQASMISGDSSL